MRTTFDSVTEAQSMRSNAAPALLPTLLLLALSPASAESQPVTVRLNVTQGTAPVLEEGFSRALFGLEEVTVVGRSRTADYALDVSTLCLPESDACEAAEAFAVSIVLSEPLTGGRLKSGLARTGDRTLQGWTPSPEASAYFQRFRTIHAMWTTHWGPDQVEAGVGRLVESLDVRCFEKHRLLRRRATLRAEGDTARIEELMADLDVEGDWLC